jgi:hypothetical protein
LIFARDNIQLLQLIECNMMCYWGKAVLTKVAVNIAFQCWVLICNVGISSFVCHVDRLAVILVSVWRLCTGCRKRLAVKFINLAGISPTAKNRSDAVQYESRLWTMTINYKNEFYGFIVLYKTMNVIISIITYLVQIKAFLYDQYDRK